MSVGGIPSGHVRGRGKFVDIVSGPISLRELTESLSDLYSKDTSSKVFTQGFILPLNARDITIQNSWWRCDTDELHRSKS